MWFFVWLGGGFRCGFSPVPGFLELRCGLESMKLSVNLDLSVDLFLRDYFIAFRCQIETSTDASTAMAV